MTVDPVFMQMNTPHGPGLIGDRSLSVLILPIGFYIIRILEH